MPGVLKALVEASFHPDKNGRTLYRLGGFWGNDTYVLDTPQRAKTLRGKLYFWYSVTLIYGLTALCLPFLLPFIDVWMLLILVFGSVPTFILSFMVVPKDLPKAADGISSDQKKEKFLSALTYWQLGAWLLIFVAIGLGSAHGGDYLPFVTSDDARFTWLAWGSAAIALLLAHFLYAKWGFERDRGKSD